MVALVLLICWPLAELFVAIKVAEAIGVLAMVVALLISIPVGFWVLRSQGRTAWRRLTTAISGGRPPAKEVADGALGVVGGTLLIVPGFISDVLGLALLLAPTRALARRTLVRGFRSRVVVAARRFSGGPRTYDVDSTATDIDSAQLHR
jgi:UPF0716 protein FxsA